MIRQPERDGSQCGTFARIPASKPRHHTKDLCIVSHDVRVWLVRVIQNIYILTKPVEVRPTSFRSTHTSAINSGRWYVNIEQWIRVYANDVQSTWFQKDAHNIEFMVYWLLILWQFSFIFFRFPWHTHSAHAAQPTTIQIHIHWWRRMCLNTTRESTKNSQLFAITSFWEISWRGKSAKMRSVYVQCSCACDDALLTDTIMY